MQKTGRPNFFKRKLLILPKFQYRLILWNVGIQTVVFWIVTLMNVSLVGQMKAMGVSAGFPVDHPYFQFVQQLSSHLFIYMGVGLILSLVLTSVAGLFISHRIAGPIFRVYRHMNETMQHKSYKSIQFRKGDYLEDLAPIMNNAFQAVIESKQDH